MAARTLAQLRTRIRRFVGDTSTTTTKQRFSNTDIDETLNDVIEEFASEALLKRDSATDTSVVGDNAYSFPTDAYKVYRMTLDDKFIPASSDVDIDQWKNDWRKDGNGTPVTWYPTKARQWKFYPPHDTAGQTIEYWYYDIPAELSSTTDSPDFAAEFHIALIRGASGALLQMDRRGDEALDHLTFFEGFKRKARARLRALEDRAKKYTFEVDRGRFASDTVTDPLQHEFFIKRS